MSKPKKTTRDFHIRWGIPLKYAFSRCAASRKEKSPCDLARQILEAWLACYLSPPERASLGIHHPLRHPELLEAALANFEPEMGTSQNRG